MKSKSGLIFICSAILAFIAGCNRPTGEATQPEMDVTQAYQTIEARLTQAVGETPAITTTVLPTNTDVPTLEVTPSPTNTALPTTSPTPKKRCDQAAAALPKIDITIDDDTEMIPGQTFTKIWRLVNAGTCIWTTDYATVWFSGEKLEAPDSLPLNASVAPGESLDISVDMSAPFEAGTYQSNWKLRNADGAFFGIGPSGESPFWVRIKVVAVATATPTPTPTSTATSVLAQASGTAALGAGNSLDLDNLVINSSGDLLFQASVDDPSQYQFAPQGSATLAIYGAAQPTLENCQSAGLSADPVTLNGLATRTHFCYRTDQGLYGRARLDAFDSNAGTVTLSILTWKLP